MNPEPVPDTRPLLFDIHLDLAMSALEWNRDLRWPLERIRRREIGMTDRPDRGNNTVCFPEMRRGNVGLCVATLFGRCGGFHHRLPAWASPEHAWAQTRAMLAWYREMEAQGELVQIRDRAGLEAHLKNWVTAAPPSDPTLQSKAPARGCAIGYILSQEGADSLVTLDYLERNVAEGLRALGPAHYGPGSYAHGTDDLGPLPPKGRELLKEMERLGLILDVTHLCDESFWDALDHFSGPVWASHHNSRSLANWNRQLADDQIQALIDRGAVIGLAFDAIMMVHDWRHLRSRPQDFNLKLEKIVEHADRIAQIAGNAEHIGIGSDLDGGFGTEQTPMDLNSIADLQSLPALFEKRGYSPADVEGIMHGNCLAFLRRVWK